MKGAGGEGRGGFQTKLGVMNSSGPLHCGLGSTCPFQLSLHPGKPKCKNIWDLGDLDGDNSDNKTQNKSFLLS